MSPEVLNLKTLINMYKYIEIVLLHSILYFKGCLPTPPGILADKKFNMWHSVGPTNMPSTSSLLQSQSSSLECEKEGLSMRSNSQQQLGAKVEIVYNLLSLLENNNSIQSSYQSVSVLLAMSKSPDCCAAMRQTGNVVINCCFSIMLQNGTTFVDFSKPGFVSFYIFRHFYSDTI